MLKYKHGQGHNALNFSPFSQMQRQKRKKNPTQAIINSKWHSLYVSYNRSHSLCLQYERKDWLTNWLTHRQLAAATSKPTTLYLLKRKGNLDNQTSVYLCQLTLKAIMSNSECVFQLINTLKSLHTSNKPIIIAHLPTILLSVNANLN